MPQRHRDIAQYRRVRQIPLQARKGQFLAQESQQSIRQTQIAFRIFKIYRIYFLRHSRGPYFPRFDTLFDQPGGNITPHILAQPQQNNMNAPQGIKGFGVAVAVVYLRRNRADKKLYFASFIQPRHQLLRRAGPIDLSKRRHMGVIGAHCAAGFAGNLLFFKLLQLAAEAAFKHFEFFAKRSRHRRLPVRTGQHHAARILARAQLQSSAHLFQKGQNYFFQRCR